MYSKKHQPSWWQLYLSLPMMIVLFLIEIRQPLSETGHILAESVIVLIIFGYISLWLRANTGAMFHEDMERNGGGFENRFKSNIAQAEKIVRKNGNLNRRPRRVRRSIQRRLARWASTAAGFFHF